MTGRMFGPGPAMTVGMLVVLLAGPAAGQVYDREEPDWAARRLETSTPAWVSYLARHEFAFGMRVDCTTGACDSAGVDNVPTREPPRSERPSDRENESGGSGQNEP